jgi:hypothetical protein
MESMLFPASSGWEEMGGVSGADPTTDGSGMPWKDVVLDSEYCVVVSPTCVGTLRSTCVSLRGLLFSI